MKPRSSSAALVVDLVSSTEVEGHTKATQAGTIDIHVVHATVGALPIDLVLFLLLFISKALHRHIGHRLSRHGPFVRTAEVGTQVFDLGIGTGHTEKQLHLGTDTQAVVDLA